MAWLKLHTNLLKNPKTTRLATLLGIEPVYAAGHLVSLWLDVLELCEDGEITKYSADEIAGLARYTGGGKRFLDAMVASCWIDRVARPGNGHTQALYIHDWADHTLGFLRIKYSQHNTGKWKELKAALEQRKVLYDNNLETLLQRTPPEEKQPKNDKRESVLTLLKDQESERVIAAATTRCIESKEEKIKSSVKNRVKKSRQVKVKHLEAVFLTNDELAKLRVLYTLNREKKQDSHGDERLKYGIQYLNDYIMSRGKTRTYKSHYHVLRQWVLSVCYEHEARGLLKFAPPPRAHRTDLVLCRDCEQMIPETEWAGHICNRNEPGITLKSVTDAVQVLRDRFKKPS